MATCSQHFGGSDEGCRSEDEAGVQNIEEDRVNTVLMLVRGLIYLLKKYINLIL